MLGVIPVNSLSFCEGKVVFGFGDAAGVAGADLVSGGEGWERLRCRRRDSFIRCRARGERGMGPEFSPVARRRRLLGLWRRILRRGRDDIGRDLSGIRAAANDDRGKSAGVDLRHRALLKGAQPGRWKRWAPGDFPGRAFGGGEIAKGDVFDIEDRQGRARDHR